MDSKESRIGKIPFTVLFFVLALAVLIDGFIWFAVRTPIMNQLDQVENQVMVVRHAQVPSVTPVATPSASITPSVTVTQQRVFIQPTQRVTPASK